jgi:hypothetical protein
MKTKRNYIKKRKKRPYSSCEDKKELYLGEKKETLTYSYYEDKKELYLYLGEKKEALLLLKKTKRNYTCI